jgi:hypothetical protein
VVVAGWVTIDLRIAEVVGDQHDLERVQEPEGRRLAAGDLEGRAWCRPSPSAGRQRVLRMVGAGPGRSRA